MHPHIKSLTAAILILALLSAGCTDTGGWSVQTATPETHPTDTVEHTEKPTGIQPTPTQDAAELPWYYGKDGFEEATIKTLSGDDLYGVKASAYGDGNYNIFDIDSGETILEHREFPSFDPYDDLQPEQARALEEQYGYPESVVMEQADTDGDGELDKVAVKYVGSKGTLDFEMDYNTGWRGVSTYIYAKLIGV
jgi:hypothetical protein